MYLPQYPKQTSAQVMKRGRTARKKKKKAVPVKCSQDDSDSLPGDFWCEDFQLINPVLALWNQQDCLRYLFQEHWLDMTPGGEGSLLIHFFFFLFFLHKLRTPAFNSQVSRRTPGGLHDILWSWIKIQGRFNNPNLILLLMIRKLVGIQVSAGRGKRKESKLDVRRPPAGCNEGISGSRRGGGQDTNLSPSSLMPRCSGRDSGGTCRRDCS